MFNDNLNAASIKIQSLPHFFQILRGHLMSATVCVCASSVPGSQAYCLGTDNIILHWLSVAVPPLMEFIVGSWGLS